MNLVGTVVVSPAWGWASTRLFLQAWLAFANLVINAIGFARGGVDRKNTALGMGVAIFGCVLYSLLLCGGNWLLASILKFGWSKSENIVYWTVSGLSLLYLLPQFPAKIRKSWRNAMIPGSLEDDIFERQLREENGGRVGA